jgi:hypothetical protein
MGRYTIKRIVYVSENLIKYGKKEQLRSFTCDCGESKALETKRTVWVQCATCKKQYQ